jgi:ABC-type phosphate transport system substrate-binding protein
MVPAFVRAGRRLAATLCWIILVSLAATPARSLDHVTAEEPAMAVVVAAGKAGATALSTSALAAIFGKRRQFWDDHTRVVPVNLPADNPLRRDFSRILFGRAPQDLQAYWNDLYFHGVLPPAVLGSEEAVLRFVSETPGAIGYVSSCSVDARVQVVATIGTPGRLQPCSRCPEL